MSSVDSSRGEAAAAAAAHIVSLDKQTTSWRLIKQTQTVFNCAPYMNVIRLRVAGYDPFISSYTKHVMDLITFRMNEQIPPKR